MEFSLELVVNKIKFHVVLTSVVIHWLMCLCIAMDQWWKITRKQSPTAGEGAFSLV